MHGRWRLFRHEAGRDCGPPAVVYVVLFVACLALGVWSARTYNAIILWPANGVMLAALLQLPRRRALPVVAACFAINLGANLYRGDPAPFWWLNATMNLAEVMIAAVLARRVGGAALDLRRPSRLWRFTFLAVVPAVALVSAVMVGAVALVRDLTPAMLIFTLRRFFDMETLGLLIVAPALLVIAKSHRFRSTAPAGRVETAILLAVLFAVTALVFCQSVAPAAFVVFPILLLVAFRAPPSWVAASVIGVAMISAAATVNGLGPVSMTRLIPIDGLEQVPPLLRQLSVYYVFMLTVLVTALPVSTVMSERRRLIERLEVRTASALEARQRAEQADAAKSRFLALMSHEMRTPLNSIVGFSEVLARRAGQTPADLDHLAHIQRSGEALLMLVEDVLEVSRGDDALHLEPIRLAEVVEAAAEPSRICADLKGLDLTIEIRPDAAQALMGDRRRLRQALHHLISNAVKFTDRGGVRVLADRLDGRILIAVTDTGCGMDAQAAGRLFDAFVQGDDSISRVHVGAGVGLTLVQRHAGLMGGDVVIDSHPGEGATFTLRLPLALAPAEAAPPPAETRPAAEPAEEGRAPRVLIVDDHPANREVARLMLTAIGCDTAEAADGDEAIDMAAAQAFDLILMDVRMPRVDGLAATRAIRAAGDATPILAVTADAMPEDAARCIAAGMDGHLPKPISHHALYAAMERLLAAPDDAEAVAAA